MKTIKTKPIVEGIKALNKAADVTARAKNAYVRTKQAAEETKQPQNSSPTEYATDKTENAVQKTTSKAAEIVTIPVKKAARGIARGIGKSGDAENRSFVKQRGHGTSDGAGSKPPIKQHGHGTSGGAGNKPPIKQREYSPSGGTVSNPPIKQSETLSAARQVTETGRGNVPKHGTKDISPAASGKTSATTRTAKTVSQSQRATTAKDLPQVRGRKLAEKKAFSRKTVRGRSNMLNAPHKTTMPAVKGRKAIIRKPVKTAVRSSGKTVKTAQQAAKAMQKSAVATARAARMTAHAARVSAKATVVTAKIIIKAVAAFVKAAIAAVKGLAALIAAGGWIALAVIVIISLIAVIVGSVFGIFFTGEENTHTGVSINSVIAELNDEFNERIDDIITSNPHDELDRSGSRALWRHVLAIYAVRTAADPYNPMDVATVDDIRAQLLRDVFWDMNVIAYEVTEYEIELDVLDDDGMPTGETETETVVVLRISVNAISVSEISALYGFTAEQQRWLEELLLPEHNSLWNLLLFGVDFIGSGTLVEIAESQIGNIGGEVYWRWYGFGERVPWCAIFVTWVAHQAGYIESGALPHFASVAVGIQWFRDNGLWFDSSYIPSPGDYIFFDWESDGSADHVGIVERVEGDYVHTIEGNSSDSVRRRTYRLDSIRIIGYGAPRHG